MVMPRPCVPPAFPLWPPAFWTGAQRGTALYLILIALHCCGLFVSQASGQDSGFDPGWYNPAAPYLKIAVTADGVYRVRGQDLLDAGAPLDAIDPATLQLFESGREVPLHVLAGAPLPAGDLFAFVGRRNTGADERWAYDYDDGLQSSTYGSLYTDTTYYWLTWGQAQGRRYAVTTTAPPTPVPTVALRDTIHAEEDNTYFFGDTFLTGNPKYTRGEGYYWHRFSHSNANPATQTYPIVLPTPRRLASDTLFVRVRFNSETNTLHKVAMELRLSLVGATAFVGVDTVSWNGLGFAELSAAIPQNQIPGDLTLRVRLTSFNDINVTATINRLLLDWIDVSYVRELAAQDGALRFSVDEGGAYAFTLTNLTTPEVRVYRPDADAFFVLTPAGNTATLLDDPAGGTTYWAVQTDRYLTPVSVRPDVPSNLAAPDNTADYVILTTPFLTPSADEMAAYRASMAGGGYQVKVVYLQDVFDQFDYGRPTPMAIRRFVRTSQTWAVPPRFMLIWGDALYPDRSRPRHAWEVPAFGHAASDGWFAMQNESLTDYIESIAIGRIPIRTNEQGLTFKEKMVHYESRPLEAWQKRALFLVGGSSQAEKNILQSFALNWSDLVTHEVTALDTLHFFKNASGPLDPTFKDSLQVAFKEGASWTAYFGHSAAQTWEIVTEPPSQFDNASRLPVVLSLGCFTGDFATGTGLDSDFLTFSEQLVVETGNGGIAHFGASASGTIVASATLSDEIHRVVFSDTLRILGTALRLAKERYALSRTDPLSVKHSLQYGLIGDPATRILLPTRPDFNITPAQITITPVTPIPADSMLTVSIAVRNQGLLPADSVTVQMTHLAPDGAATLYTRRIAPFGIETTVAFEIPINERLVGDNRFQVILDPMDAFVEEDEFNNSAEQSQVIFSTGLSLSTPFNFGLTASASPTLRVSLANPTPVPVAFELDTVPTFDSPARVEHRQEAALLTASWQPAGLRDGTTYYWRARVDESSQPWKEGAFTIATDLGEEGWLQQGDLFRFNENSPLLERTDAQWRFRTFIQDVGIEASRPGGTTAAQFVINSDFFERLHLGFALLVMDGGTGEIKGHTSGATYPNAFEDPAQVFAALQDLAAQAQPGDYVFTSTRHFANQGGEVIPDSIKALFRSLGSVAIDTLTYNHMWMMSTRLGIPGSTIEVVEPPGTGVNDIATEVSATFSFGEGTTLSPPIGPAQRWQDLGWTAELANTASSIRVDVLDAADGAVLMDAGTMAVDLSSIDARTHPFLRLRATFADTTKRTTPQLTRWHVGYQGVADLALDPSALQTTADTLLEGQPMVLTAVVRNLNLMPADSALLEYRLINPANESRVLRTDTLLQVDDQATSTLTIDTFGLVGTNRLQLTLRQPGVPEETTFNNVMIRTFVIQKDRTAPEFEVLIDGEAFPDDPNPVVNLQDPALPFVSSRPTIEITVRDENPFLALKGDTTIVSVTLDDRPLPFDLLAGAGKRKLDNELRLQFQPDFSGQDTTHTLRLTVHDASGNAAVGSPYQVHFRTSSSLLVENVFPYPNPMSSFTVFAFRLIGPDATQIRDFRIRIYTLSGLLIREFDLLENPGLTEAGGLRIGWNKVRWDGRDEDGDRVATGVYLYKVFVNARDTAEDFNRATDVGKVVVIR